MKTSYIIIMFIVLAGIQLYVPAAMIMDQENVLKNGKAYKFKTQPIDPNDPFRGKYITLNYDIEGSYPVQNKSEYGKRVYVLLKEDENGFAQVDDILSKKPESGNYIRVEESRYSYNEEEIDIEILQNRFYMEESKAPEAEIAYGEVNRRGKEAYAVIYV